MIHKSYTTNICLVVLCAILMANVALCDLYTHNPRGSINRNCERDANRRNANRLFDSQDNAAGGYACPRSVGGPEVKTPKMYYYEGSELYLEWTSQHSCGEHNNYCELVIQYMCNDTQVGTDNVYGPFYAVRDGIPTDGNDDATDTVTEATKYNLRYGVHEQFENYQKCTTRKRNFGLYIADRNIGDRAVNTRQNNGEKFGFECVEERDYYPYWHASPWVDVAVFTSNTSLCQFYQENSQNVAPRGECWDATKTKYLEHNNIRDCIDKDKTNLWIEVAAWGVAAPECLSSTLIAARDNYLGNSVDGEMARYKWTLPFISEMPYDSVAKKTHHENCVLRFRYNITTTETPFFMDARYNYRAADKTSITPIKQDPWESFGYQNELHMAVNTNQYGRTFEDRSYVFEIRERPTTVPKWVKIHNLNVRGKRGNIVNVFPSTEYDFVPNNLKVNTGAGDLVHIQFSGSDYNPNRTPNNAEGGPKDPAQGGYRADRNNIVQLDIAGLNTPRKYSGITMFLKEDGSIDSELAHKLAFAGQNYADNVTSCLSKTALLAKNGGSTAQAELDDNNCGKLANTPYGPYFDGGLVKMWASGKFYYMCTRNNNFSNRGQKAIMIVEGAKWSAAQTTAPSSMTLLIALSSVLILAFNMLF